MDLENLKSEKNDFNFNNISLLLNYIKNNNKQEDNEKGNLLNINSINSSSVKAVLPYITEDSDNIYKILNYLEINQLITKYREAYKNIDKEQIFDLKKEAMLHIKSNINDKNKFMVDLFLKAMEMKNIIKSNYQGGNVW